MANTQGFEIVAEVTVPMLLQVLQAAWKSGGDPASGGVIPEFFDIPPGTNINPFIVQDGQVQIPQEELDIAMATGVNGVDIKFGMRLQIELQNPPVPSASMFSMTADCHAQVPVGALPGTVNVGILLAGLPRANVTTTLTSGDPIAPNIEQYIAEYVHQLYENDGAAFPHTIAIADRHIEYLGFPAYTVDVFVELFDDPMNPAHRIEITRPPNQVQIGIPIHLRIHNIRKDNFLAPSLLDPMGIETRMILTAPFSATAGAINAQITAATVTNGPLAPAPGVEGTNYTSNSATVAGLLPGIIAGELINEGENMAVNMGDIEIDHPTIAQIETAIGDAFHQQLLSQGSLAVWTPDTGGGSPAQVNDVTTRALADTLAIAINAGGGANINALTNFVPASRLFAIAIGASRLLAIIDDSLHRPESEGGFGPGFPPKHFDNVDDHEADLTALDISLASGAIHMEGDVTVIDAILDSIDVDASFEVDVGLHWEDNADGTQRIVSDPGEPDVDLSLLAWIVSFLVGFITFGLIGGVIGLVVVLIVEGIAQSIGGKLILNNVTNQVEGIGAWPSDLVKIGTVEAKFENPIEIGSEGMVLAG